MRTRLVAAGPGRIFDVWTIVSHRIGARGIALEPLAPRDPRCHQRRRARDAHVRQCAGHDGPIGPARYSPCVELERFIRPTSNICAARSSRVMRVETRRGSFVRESASLRRSASAAATTEQQAIGRQMVFRRLVKVPRVQVHHALSRRRWRLHRDEVIPCAAFATPAPPVADADLETWIGRRVEVGVEEQGRLGTTAEQFGADPLFQFGYAKRCRR